jgi:PAS domain S-box-containing protein
MNVTGTRLFIGLLHDVTKLLEALSLAEACFSEANDPMVVINEQGIIQRWNTCASSTFHFAAEDAIGQNISFLMPEPYRSQHDSFLKQYLGTGERKVIGKPRNVPVVTGQGVKLMCSLKVSAPVHGALSVPPTLRLRACTHDQRSSTHGSGWIGPVCPFQLTCTDTRDYCILHAHLGGIR